MRIAAARPRITSPVLEDVAAYLVLTPIGVAVVAGAAWAWTLRRRRATAVLIEKDPPVSD